MKRIKLKHLINEGVSRNDLKTPAFVEGMKLAGRDKKEGVRKDMKGMSGDFVRGYEAVMDYQNTGGDSWWDRANEKVTKWVADLGTTFFSNRE